MSRSFPTINGINTWVSNWIYQHLLWGDLKWKIFCCHTQTNIKFCYLHRKRLNSVLGKVLAERINKSLQVNKKKIYPKEKAADVSRMMPGRGCLVASSLRAFLKRRLHFLGRGSRVSNEALPDVWVSLSLSRVDWWSRCTRGRPSPPFVVLAGRMVTTAWQDSTRRSG